jgi:hypothetical protein
MNNIKQIQAGLFAYAGENRDKLPALEPPGTAAWAWDLPWNVGETLLTSVVAKKSFYCAGTASRFDDGLNFGNMTSGQSLWYFDVPNIHIAGYVFAFAGSLSKLYATNQNTTLQAERIYDSGNVYLTGVADRVLMADATLSATTPGGGTGGGSDSQKYTECYYDIKGGFYVHHLSAHLDKLLPIGGNVGFKDGHAEWRKFADMHERAPGGLPDFWW